MSAATIERPCNASAECCLCKRPSGHNAEHRCPCGGAWTGEYTTASFRVITFPFAAEYGGAGTIALDDPVSLP